MIRWITLQSVLVSWGLSTVVHENPKPAVVFEPLVHTAAHTTGLWLM
jgi:hypothetical protein